MLQLCNRLCKARGLLCGQTTGDDLHGRRGRRNVSRNRLTRHFHDGSFNTTGRRCRRSAHELVVVNFSMRTDDLGQLVTIMHTTLEYLSHKSTFRQLDSAYRISQVNPAADDLVTFEGASGRLVR